MTYNPWPLGQLPPEFQRPEPDLVRKAGYAWEDPRDIIDMFEARLARYAGSKFAVAVDSCTHALFLSMKYEKVTGSISIPAQTYASVPMQILHAGAMPAFRDIEWSGAYRLGETRIIDGAARFTSGMYSDPDSLHCLSFQIKKTLPIGRGGAILTDDLRAAEWLRLARYDGRDLKTPYTSTTHVGSLGWHYYMTPEDAARGLLLLDQIPAANADMMDWNHYPDLRVWFSRILSEGVG